MTLYDFMMNNSSDGHLPQVCEYMYEWDGLATWSNLLETCRINNI